MSFSRCIQLKKGLRTEGERRADPVKEAASQNDAAFGEEPYAIIVFIMKS